MRSIEVEYGGERVELLPCPFCGGEPKIHSFKRHGWWYRIRCVGDCSIHPETYTYRELAQACAIWNRRPEANAPPPVPKEKAAREKREILVAIEAYRREHGPGSVPVLAKLSKVGEGELWAMIACEQAPVTTWRKVGKALGVSGAGGKGEKHEAD